MDTKIFELKEIAKWSAKIDERRSAIRELASKGQDAVSALEEIRDVVVGIELKNLCLDALEEIRNSKNNDTEAAKQKLPA